ncbi:unnamed protein product [Heligmosomoides polygyrus]|uniref:Uncharacterized protein n=1 Tax=Heligmosomoides polygyrus TaxID=6339 RepID=A0A183GF41_HELPZ|nr:unnamed protein product [Heligmosomoides polygyrus]
MNQSYHAKCGRPLDKKNSGVDSKLMQASSRKTSNKMNLSEASENILKQRILTCTVFSIRSVVATCKRIEGAPLGYRHRDQVEKQQEKGDYSIHLCNALRACYEKT